MTLLPVSTGRGNPYVPDVQAAGMSRVAIFTRFRQWTDRVGYGLNGNRELNLL